MREKILPRNYTFNYTRLINGIPFPGNGFSVQVDPYTGEVTNYRLIWWGLSFPAPTGLMDKDKAIDNFLTDSQLKLYYQRFYNEGKETETNLVYSLKNHPSYMLDARSGAAIDWTGQPIPSKQNVDFNDIAGHPAENDIKLLVQAKVLSTMEGQFRPDSNITKLEAIEWLVKSRGWYTAPTLLTRENPEERKTRIINSAINLGIIESNETGELDKELTRLELARLMINTLDYDGAAKLSNIYNLSSKDEKLVSPELKGYAALSLGLGLQSEINGEYQLKKRYPEVMLHRPLSEC
ncbi:hypothetical protein N752_20990 [Desulforamulus aquiferis]|nr:YcdB/YcdC domain-containing protein [Desulforamulus aquiferis]RYD03310.1 hypothetical protein N752_20990 [Desulforamulus aquiferis]